MDPAEIEKIIVSRNYECPVCGNPFSNYSLRSSKLKMVNSDSDLKAYYEPYDPMYYDVIICSGCGYSAVSSGFADLRNKQVELIENYLRGKFKPREYPKVYSPSIAADRYKMALISALAKKGKDSEIANICLKLSWLYRDIKDKDNESKFRGHAIKYFVMAMEKEDFPIASMDAPTLDYLLGELNRREGNYEEASRYISSVIVNKEISPRLRERAEIVRELLKEHK